MALGSRRGTGLRGERFGFGTDPTFGLNSSRLIDSDELRDRASGISITSLGRGTAGGSSGLIFGAHADGSRRTAARMVLKRSVLIRGCFGGTFGGVSSRCGGGGGLRTFSVMSSEYLPSASSLSKKEERSGIARV